LNPVHVPSNPDCVVELFNLFLPLNIFADYLSSTFKCSPKVDLSSTFRAHFQGLTVL